MRRLLTRIDSVTFEPTGHAGARLLCPAALQPQAGQMAMAVLPGSPQTVRTPLFPTGADLEGFVCDLPDGAVWSPGDRVDLLTPVGNGFSPPRGTRRWMLWAIGCRPSRLLPLVDLGLSRHASVALAASEMPARLPAEVELLAEPLVALGWADYLAIDLGPGSVAAWKESLLSPDPAARPPLHSQVLVSPPMPCAIGVCSACAVQTRRGWSLACVDGPVFDLARLAG